MFLCLLTIHPSDGCIPGVKNLSHSASPPVMILQFPAATNNIAVSILPQDPCENLPGIQTMLFLLQPSMCLRWNRKPVHLEIIFLKKLDYCNNSLEAGWSRGGAQIWIYRKSEPRLYLSNNYFVNVFSPLYSTHVPWDISLRLTQRWLRFLALWPWVGVTDVQGQLCGVPCANSTHFLSLPELISLRLETGDNYCLLWGLNETDHTEPGLIKARKPLSLRNSQQRRKIQVQMFTAKCQGPRPQHGQTAMGSGRRAHGSKWN